MSGISAGKRGHNSGMEVVSLKKQTFWTKVGDFLEGKGFYIVLALCLAAIGGSGYYLYRTVSLSQTMPTRSVSARAEVPEELPDLTGEDKPEEAPGDAARQETPKPEDEEAVNRPGENVREPEADAAETGVIEETPGENAPGDQDLTAPPSKPSAEQQASGGEREAEKKPAAKAAKWLWPTQGEVLETFSVKKLTYNAALGDWRAHTGIDIAARAGDPVASASAGTVVAVKDDPVLGRTVTVESSGGLRAVYGNLAEETSVSSGDHVDPGQVIGAVGQTAAGESHDTAWLHFAVEKNGKPRNPTKYLEKK